MSNLLIMVTVVVVGVLALAVTGYLRAHPVRRTPTRDPRPLSRSRRPTSRA